jgi:hypothetical protein
MNPEDRALLERALKLSEENNQILLKMQRTARIAFIWGFIKVLIIIVPLVLGYILLAPFVGDAVGNYGQNYSELKTLLEQ